MPREIPAMPQGGKGEKNSREKKKKGGETGNTTCREIPLRKRGEKKGGKDVRKKEKNKHVGAGQAFNGPCANREKKGQDKRGGGGSCASIPITGTKKIGRGGGRKNQAKHMLLSPHRGKEKKEH